jgi:hypothetical protein
MNSVLFILRFNVVVELLVSIFRTSFVAFNNNRVFTQCDHVLPKAGNKLFALLEEVRNDVVT